MRGHGATSLSDLRNQLRPADHDIEHLHASAERFLGRLALLDAGNIKGAIALIEAEIDRQGCSQ